MKSALRVATIAAEEAMSILALNRPQLVKEKGQAIDLVTEIDERVERAVRARLEALMPGVPVAGEEQGGDLKELCWVVDPLDGTTNFVHGYPWYSVSIALVERGEPVVGVVGHPAMNRIFGARLGGGATCNGERIHVSEAARFDQSLLSTGFPYDRRQNVDAYLARVREALLQTRGIRRCGSAALDLASVACGELDGYWEFHLSLWDVAAGTLLVREAGGQADVKGSPDEVWLASPTASNGLIHESLVRLVQEGPEVIRRSSSLSR